VISSHQNTPNTASLTWPANGISTYHLVSNIFDCLINSVYGLSDTTEVLSISNKRESDTPFEMNSPTKGCCTENSSRDASSRYACEQSSVAVTFPKTKKQMATSKLSVDQKGLQTYMGSQGTFPAGVCAKTESDTEAMTLGELQEKLITKVVENGSISRLLEFGSNKQSECLVQDVNEKLCQRQLANSRSPEGRSRGSSSEISLVEKPAVSSDLCSPSVSGFSTAPSGKDVSFFCQTLRIR
jgi:hypothetical protein